MITYIWATVRQADMTSLVGGGKTAPAFVNLMMGEILKIEIITEVVTCNYVLNQLPM